MDVITEVGPPSADPKLAEPADGLDQVDAGASPASAAVEELPRRQAEALSFICRYSTFNQIMPTGREILSGIAVGGTNAAVYVGPLILKGYLVREGRRHRSLRLTPKALRWFESQPPEQPELNLIRTA
jgi:hypothetical protein